MFMNITCEGLVANNHAYRTIQKILNLKETLKRFEELYAKVGAPGIPIEKGFKALLIQFMEDYSDRQMEAALRENIAVKWFCGFELKDETPDHSYFGKLRNRLGHENVAQIFNDVGNQMKSRGLRSNVFTFIDATALITKTALWEERDRAIKDGLDKLNNETVGKYSADKDARFGCKGKNKFWYGYKRHVAVDMQHRVITKIVTTSANVSDGKALPWVCPDRGIIFGDKSYCGKKTRQFIQDNGCHSAVILKNNMKGKDHTRDKFLTRLRMPYEGLFSLFRRRVRYRGLEKVSFQSLMEALVINIKRWAKITVSPHKTGYLPA